MRKLNIAIVCLVVLGSSAACQLLQLAPAPSAPLPTAAHVATATLAPVVQTSKPAPAPAASQPASQTALQPPPFNDGLEVVRPEFQAELPGLAQAPRYAIAWKIAGDGSYQGVETVRLTNTEGLALDRLYFRLLPNGGKSYGNGSLTVSEARLNGQAVDTSLSVDDTALELTLPQPLAAGESLTVTLAFAGTTPHDYGPEGEQGYGIYNLTRNILTLANAYPILAVYDQQGWNLDAVSEIGDSVYSDTAFYSVRLCLPEGWLVAATGPQVDGPSGEADGCTLHASGPTRDFFIAASPDFQVTEQQVGEVTVRSFALPNDAAGSQAALAVAARSMDILQQRFGDYVFNRFDVVETPLMYAAGVEYPGLVLIDADMYAEPEDPVFIMTIAHEVSHQWWYSLVGNDVFDEPWLDEALATYSSMLYFEATPGGARPRDFLELWRNRWQQLRDEGGDEPVVKPLSYFEQPEKQKAYGAVVYRKGALFFDALRKEIGDEAFFGALRKFYAQKRYGIATTQDLLALFEQESGRSLQDLYQEWLFTAQPAK
jgi:hypothetical protein